MLRGLQLEPLSTPVIYPLCADPGQCPWYIANIDGVICSTTPKKFQYKNWLSRLLLYNRVLGYFLMYSGASGGDESWRVRFGFFYRTSYVGLTSRQHLATVIRYADCVKRTFRASRRCLRENFNSFNTWFIILWLYIKTTTYYAINMVH